MLISEDPEIIQDNPIEKESLASFDIKNNSEYCGTNSKIYNFNRFSAAFKCGLEVIPVDRNTKIHNEGVFGNCDANS